MSSQKTDARGILCDDIQNKVPKFAKLNSSFKSRDTGDSVRRKRVLMRERHGSLLEWPSVPHPALSGQGNLSEPAEPTLIVV